MVWSIARFEASFGTAYLIFVQIILSSVTVAEWQPFGKKLFPCLFYVLYVPCLFVVLVIYRFGFENRVLVLIVLGPGRCTPSTFLNY